MDINKTKNEMLKLMVNKISIFLNHNDFKFKILLFIKSIMCKRQSSTQVDIHHCLLLNSSPDSILLKYEIGNLTFNKYLNCRNY